MLKHNGVGRGAACVAHNCCENAMHDVRDVSIKKQPQYKKDGDYPFVLIKLIEGGRCSR